MSPRSKTQNQAVRARSMQGIKQAAMELFAKYGYQSTSISQIAKEAGVSKGLLYNYFDNKEDLLHQILVDAIGLVDMMMEQFRKSEVGPREKLEMIIETSIGALKANLHFWKLMTSLVFQTDALKSVAPLLKQKQEQLLHTLTHVFAQNGVQNPEEEAYLLAASMDGIAMHFMHLEIDYPLDKMKAYLLKKYCK